MGGKHWTPEQLEVLKVEYPDGARLDELAQKLRKSPTAIKTVASRLHLERITRQVSASPFRLAEGEQLLAHLSERDRAYIAGLFDGEGWVMIAYGKPTKRRPSGAYHLSVGITSTDPRVIEWLCERVPAKLWHAKAPNETRRDSYQWRLALYRGAQFCREIAPYLIIKREEAELVGEALRNGFAPLSADRREELRSLLQVLKTKGYRGYPDLRLP
jgi:hypothetical protein